MTDLADPDITVAGFPPVVLQLLWALIDDKHRLNLRLSCKALDSYASDTLVTRFAVPEEGEPAPLATVTARAARYSALKHMRIKNICGPYDGSVMGSWRALLSQQRHLREISLSKWAAW